MDMGRFLIETHLRTGLLRQEVSLDRTGVGEIGDQLVAVTLTLHVVDGKHPHDWLFESDRYDLAALRHGLAGAKEERHALPACVLDVGA